MAGRRLDLLRNGQALTAVLEQASTDVSIELTVTDAVALCAAWASRLAREVGIRALVVKGAPLSSYGLRDARSSADVDILIEPDRIADFRQSLLSAGWTERQIPRINDRIGAHSRTYLHHRWPCDIDVHAHFPGFLADPKDVFDALWARRMQHPFAHISVDVPDRIASALILALHSLRDGNVRSLHRAEYEGLRQISLSDEDRRLIADTVVITGSAATLDPILASWHVDLTDAERAASAATHDRTALATWRGRVAARSNGAYTWWLTLESARGIEKAAVVYRALWPRAEEIRLAHPEVPDRTGPLAWARIVRLGRGLRGIPASVRALRIRA